LNLEEYLEIKGKQRTSASSSTTFSSKKVPLKKSKSPKDVIINVGLMEPDSYGELKKKRGVWAHLSVSPKADANTIQKLAIEKHASLDQFFCGLEDYV